MKNYLFNLIIYYLFILGILVDNSIFHKKLTLHGLLTNFFSFTPFRYKIGLIRTLIDRTFKFKINNTSSGVTADLVPPADLVPFNKILADLVPPPQKHLVT